MNTQRNAQPPKGSFFGEITPAKSAGLLYSVSALVYLLAAVVVSSMIVGQETRGWAVYLTFLAAPIAFALSAVWYFSYTKTPVKSFLREQKCHPKYYLLALLLQIGLLSLGELNGLFLRFLERFGYQSPDMALPSLDGFGFVGGLLAVAVLPAAMEELFFRGLLQRGMKGFSLVGQVLLSGALFALYHQNPAQTIYQFICGAAFALVAARAGSFLPTVLSHFINNAYVLTLYKLGITSYGAPMYAIMLVISGICLLSSLLYLTVFDKKKQEEKVEEKGYKKLLLFASVGLLVFAVSWIAALATGF